ncbi:hypothetical protein D9M68_957030 [compost metagenome]
MDLGLDHPGAVAEGLRGRDRFVRRGGDFAGRDRDAVLGQQLLGLIFVEIHASPWVGNRRHRPDRGHGGGGWASPLLSPTRPGGAKPGA